MKDLKIYINGEWSMGDSGHLSVKNPATGEIPASVPKISPSQVKSAVDDAEIAF